MPLGRRRGGLLVFVGLDRKFIYIRSTYMYLSDKKITRGTGSE